VRPLSTEVEAFVLDIELAPNARGRGLGRATMVAAEQAARSLGASVMRLNVFGHNAPARRLYAARGFRVARTALALRVGADERPAGSREGLATAGSLGLRRARPEEVEPLRRLVLDDQAVRQRSADVLPEAEARAQATATAAEWAAALASGVALIAEADDDRVLALVQLEDGPDGRRAQLHLTGAAGCEATPPTRALLARLARAVQREGAVSAEVTLHAEPPEGAAGYRVTAQTMVKRW